MKKASKLDVVAIDPNKTSLGSQSDSKIAATVQKVESIINPKSKYVILSQN